MKGPPGQRPARDALQAVAEYIRNPEIALLTLNVTGISTGLLLAEKIPAARDGVNVALGIFAIGIAISIYCAYTNFLISSRYIFGADGSLLRAISRSSYDRLREQEKVRQGLTSWHLFLSCFVLLMALLVLAGRKSADAQSLFGSFRPVSEQWVMVAISLIFAPLLVRLLAGVLSKPALRHVAIAAGAGALLAFMSGVSLAASAVAAAKFVEKGGEVGDRTRASHPNSTSIQINHYGGFQTDPISAGPPQPLQIICAFQEKPRPPIVIRPPRRDPAPTPPRQSAANCPPVAGALPQPPGLASSAAAGP